MKSRLALALATCLVLAACTGAGPAKSSKKAEPGALGDLPVAPESQRVDMGKPTFSNPTKVTNPLFPISNLKSAILLGNVDGSILRVETTLLPETKTIEWKGKKVETLVSQYIAYLDGRIHELALDFYAQADDGAVWYFGEDVFNYEDGAVANTEGTWLAGKDGPAAMIMPARPAVGNVFRPENIPGVVFEEVTVVSVGERVEGPRGSVDGAIVTRELHMDGALESKTFAPGYGEFFTGFGGEVEAIALAVPTDALATETPPELEDLESKVMGVFEAAGIQDWDSANAGLTSMKKTWAAYRAKASVPKLLDAQLSRSLEALEGDVLVPAIAARNPTGTRRAALAAGQAVADLQLQFKPPAEVDLARFQLWVDQVLVDTARNEPGAVAGDVTVLEKVWDRIAHTADAGVAKSIEQHLNSLRSAAGDEDVKAAAGTIPALLQEIQKLSRA